MRDDAKFLRTRRSKVVHLPKQLQYSSLEVFVEKDGDGLIVLRRPASWARYLEHGRRAADDFMDRTEDLPGRAAPVATAVRGSRVKQPSVETWTS